MEFGFQMNTALLFGIRHFDPVEYDPAWEFQIHCFCFCFFIRIPLKDQDYDL